MKRSTLILVAFMFVLLAESAAQQQQPTSTRKRPIREGENSINLYYGTNLLAGIYKSVAASTAENVKVRSMGPIGLVYEHMLTNVIGLGVELGYAHTTLEYHDTELYYANGQPVSYNYSLNFTTYRAMVRANFHFAESDKFDAYGLVSGGYRSTSFTYHTENPYDKSHLSYKSIFPFGVKVGLGLRYFFTPNIGINLEMALGTPLLCGGLSFKF
jgi:opacity protein-like surface antigen